MDSRIRQHAEVIADHSTSIGDGDQVVIAAEPGADPLVEALSAIAGRRGASTVLLRTHPRATKAYLNAADGELPEPSAETALFAEADVAISILASTNERELAGVSNSRLQAFERARQPIQEQRFATRWLTTLYPTPAAAQNAGMSTDEYEDFVWEATLIDWEEQRRYQAKLGDRLDEADTFRLVADETDLRMRTGKNPIMNDHGQHNLPGGEVSTAPIVDSVEGRIHFDIPLGRHGRTLRGAWLVFEEGEVVDFGADANIDLLEELIATDAGAKRLGELGIGMNHAIDRFTDTVLFDEKMHRTVHVALGRAYRQIVADGNERNESAVHVDLITSLESARIELDGEAVYENNSYVFE